MSLLCVCVCVCSNSHLVCDTCETVRERIQGTMSHCHCDLGGCFEIVYTKKTIPNGESPANKLFQPYISQLNR